MEEKNISRRPHGWYMEANSFSQSYKSATLLLGIRNNINRERILERPILKLVMILEPNDINSPMKGA